MNNFCDFISLGDGDFYCAKCGRTIYTDDADPPFLPCPKKIDEDPNCCSQHQVTIRFEICKLCDKFTTNVCSECGCLVSNTMHFTNKLFWKNNSCPLNKWGKIN